MNVQSEKPKIIAWLKPSCGWSQGVRAVLRKYDLPYEDRDIINNPDFYQEMVEKTGQMRQPCLEINGRILADVSGDAGLLEASLGLRLRYEIRREFAPYLGIEWTPAGHAEPHEATAVAGIRIWY